MNTTFRDRIVEFTRVPADELVPHSRNWRTHDEQQKSALSGVLEEIGFAGALLARRRADGRLELIDGHLRAATSKDQLVPVLVLDVDEGEADNLLAAFDTITTMAGRDNGKLAELLQRTSPKHPAMRQLFQSLHETVQREQGPRVFDQEAEIPPAFQVLIECRNETEQQAVYERLVDQGLDCRLLVL